MPSQCQLSAVPTGCGREAEMYAPIVISLQFATVCHQSLKVNFQVAGLGQIITTFPPSRAISFHDTHSRLFRAISKEESECLMCSQLFDFDLQDVKAAADAKRNWLEKYSLDVLDMHRSLRFYMN
jgi:hypothetical protein